MSMLGLTLWRSARIAIGLAGRQREVSAVKEMLGAEIDKRDKLTEALRESLEQLRQEVGEYKQSGAAASTAASDGGGSVVTAAVVIGSLGWNVSAEQLIERAKALLAEALPDVHASLPLVPIVNHKGKGDAVETLLPTSMVLDARVRVKALRRCLPGAKGAAWLDNRRSQRDAASACMFHKLCEAVAELEEPRPDAHTIVNKKVQARQLWTQGGQRVAWLHCLRARWSPWALNRYQMADMYSAPSFAEGSRRRPPRRPVLAGFLNAGRRCGDQASTEGAARHRCGLSLSDRVRE